MKVVPGTGTARDSAHLPVLGRGEQNIKHKHWLNAKATCMKPRGTPAPMANVWLSKGKHKGGRKRLYFKIRVLVLGILYSFLNSHSRSGQHLFPLEQGAQHTLRDSFFCPHCRRVGVGKAAAIHLQSTRRVPRKRQQNEPAR